MISVAEQLTPRRQTRLLHRRAFRPLLLGLFFQMKLQLLLQFVFPAAPLNQPFQLAQKLHHDSSPAAGFKINAIARANVCHFDCSTASCFRPNAVRR